LAFMQMHKAYLVLLMDTVVGLLLFLRHHYIAGDFS
jgi:hypothetical protein